MPVHYWSNIARSLLSRWSSYNFSLLWPLKGKASFLVRFLGRSINLRSLKKCLKWSWGNRSSFCSLSCGLQRKRRMILGIRSWVMGLCTWLQFTYPLSFLWSLWFWWYSSFPFLRHTWSNRIELEGILCSSTPRTLLRLQRRVAGRMCLFRILLHLFSCLWFLQGTWDKARVSMFDSHCLGQVTLWLSLVLEWIQWNYKANAR